MTLDVGPPTSPSCSLDASVAMASLLATDAGIVDTAGCSQASSTPSMQVCFLCTIKTLKTRFTTQWQMFTMVDVCCMCGKLAAISVHVRLSAFHTWLWFVGPTSSRSLSWTLSHWHPYPDLCCPARSSLSCSWSVQCKRGTYHHHCCFQVGGKVVKMLWDGYDVTYSH